MAGLWPGGEALTSLTLYPLATLLSNKEREKNFVEKLLPETFFILSSKLSINRAVLPLYNIFVI